jgi:hypothetical protein
MSERRRLAERFAIAALAAVVTASAGCGADPPRVQVTALPGSAAGASPADVVRVQYGLRNLGGRPLVVDGVAPACGCRPVGAIPVELAPGASATLAVDCRAPETAGETMRELRLRTNDPASPSIPLRVTLRKPTPGPVPSSLYFGYVALGDSAARDLVVPSTTSAAHVAATAHAGLAVESLPPRPDGARGLRVRFTPTAPGVMHAILDVGGTAVPVTGVGYDRLIAYPAMLVRALAQGRNGARSVTLIAAGAEPLALGRVEYPPGLTGELKVVEPGRQWRLLIRGRAVSAADGTALIRLFDAAAAPLLVIPVAADDGALPAPTA